jgi:hypothetical protein
MACATIWLLNWQNWQQRTSFKCPALGRRPLIQCPGLGRIMAIQHYFLTGFAYVEVNGEKGLLITVKTGSGQGDPVSSILFLLATEPLNRALAQNYRNLMYKTESNFTVGPILFADDKERVTSNLS